MEKNKSISHIDVDVDSLGILERNYEENESEEYNMPGSSTPAEFLTKSIDQHYKVLKKNKSGKHKRLFTSSLISSSGLMVKPQPCLYLNKQLTIDGKCKQKVLNNSDTLNNIEIANLSRNHALSHPNI